MKVVAQLQYEKVTQIGVGEGLNSAVFLVRDEQIAAQIVAKEIPKAKVVDPVRYFEECKAMFASEAPNVVPVRCGCATTDEVCILMPFYSAGSLQTRISVNPISVGAVVRVGIDVLNGLSSIHKAGLLHFDLKPTNVLFSDAGAALVADFGQARPVDPTSGVVSSANIPPLYSWGVSPETLSAGAATVHSDIYQAGLTLYRAVNGEPHYRKQVDHLKSMGSTGTTRDKWIKAGDFPDRTAFQPHVPKGLKDLICNALDVDPRKRPQTALDFRDRLARVNPPIDWHMESCADGSRCWQGARVDQTDLVVEVVPNGGDFSIAVFTVGDGAQRRRKTSLCQTVTASRVEVELREVFRVLAQA